jgi:DNA-binding CsgD family transcriptional regulator
MAVQIPGLNYTIYNAEQKSNNGKGLRPPLSQNGEQQNLLQGLIENLIDGILILTEDRELVYANESAHRVLRQLNQNRPHANLVPREIWHICQSLIQSRSLFPNQRWLIESKIFIDDSTALNIRVRWLNLDAIANPCLLLTLEDRYQAIRNIAVEEAQNFGLTPREKEVWLLHRAHYTYKNIASELEITPNTVKKHMKSIHAKQKKSFGSEN